jgi:phosphoglucosamine mutase
VRTETKINLQSDKKLTQAIDKIESKLADTGRILVRESGTEPLIRVMVESAHYDLGYEFCRGVGRDYQINVITK